MYIANKTKFLAEVIEETSHFSILSKSEATTLGYYAVMGIKLPTVKKKFLGFIPYTTRPGIEVFEAINYTKIRVPSCRWDEYIDSIKEAVKEAEKQIGFEISIIRVNHFISFAD